MEPCVAAVGSFDGVHLGHRAIISRAIEIGRQKGLKTRAITFITHPLTVIAPHRAPLWAIPRSFSIRNLEEKFDEVSQLDFTPDLAKLTAREFMALLKQRFNVDTLVMGYDNTFGSDRLSSREQYEAAGRDTGINVEFVDAVHCAEGRPLSSSRLRKAIAAWNSPEIEAVLGEYPVYTAKVVEGKHLGRKLGFPTLNVELTEDSVPLPDGVYAAITSLDKSEEGALAVLSVGNNPTVGDGKRSYELHVIDRDLPPMYGKKISFNPFMKLRDIKRFDSLDELKQAIRADILQAKQLLANK